MQNEDRPTFATLLAALGSVFGKPVDEGLIAGYWMALEDLTAADFERAVSTATRTLKFFPKPVELRDIVRGGDWEDRAKGMAIHAWPEVMRLSARSSGDHSDPVAKEVIRLMGGGKRLGQMETQDIEVWGRKQFEEIYATVYRKLEDDPRALESAEVPDQISDTVHALARKLGS